VVFGSSTGGPFALSKILSQFPVDLKAAVIVIQHVDQQFASGFADWLGGQIKYVAGRNDHLVMISGTHLRYTPIPEEVLYRPSVDVFFQSVAHNWPKTGVAVLLTGMGNDGANGMKALFDRGWLTIAEHQNSCVVYGMPKAAIEAGAAKEILLLDKIASAVLN
jgi:two-component system response regulator WspF